MEVHKHPHHVMHNKKWGEYLLEFLMLFLAVFLGFVAENIREGQVEKHREHEYIESLVNDLKTDTAKISSNMKKYDPLIKMLDTLQQSLIDNIHAADCYFKPSIRNKILRLKNGFPDFIYTDGTIQQLKNSGNLRLLQNRQVVDSIMAYDSKVQSALINQKDVLEPALYDFINELNTFYNYRLIDSMGTKGKQMNVTPDTNYVFQHFSAEVDRFYTKLKKYKSMLEIVGKNWLADVVKPKAISTISFLKKEYHLEKE